MSAKHRQPAHTDVMWVAVNRRTCLRLSTCIQKCFVPFSPLPKKIGPNCCLELERSYPSFSFQSENCAKARYASRHRWLGVQKFQIWGIKGKTTIGKSWFCVTVHLKTFDALWAIKTSFQPLKRVPFAKNKINKLIKRRGEIKGNWKCPNVNVTIWTCSWNL